MSSKDKELLKLFIKNKIIGILCNSTFIMAGNITLNPVGEKMMRASSLRVQLFRH
jgi:hypothetical protein